MHSDNHVKLSSGCSQTPSPIGTVLSSTRYTIDHFNYTFNLQTDETSPGVSAGSYDKYRDGVGSARATAVLFQTPAGDGNPFTPVRCDLFLFKSAGQTQNFLQDSGLTLSVYADGGSDAHFPGAVVGSRARVAKHGFYHEVALLFARRSPLLQLSQPLALSDAKALLTYRSNWYQITVVGTGATTDWPILKSSTYYWAVLAPSNPTLLGFTTQYPFNGPLWGGIDISVTSIPAGASSSSPLFTARELNSQRFAGDTQFGAKTQAGVDFVLKSKNWGSLPSNQVVNWAAAQSNIRYGIQVLGWQVNPTPTSTATGEGGDKVVAFFTTLLALTDT